ncbi:uncharacterized protein LOC133909203 [Phragmites australis]|uniref:uncharacterized protein LOC133909203 n=1 Tax=Phragmites australis TaxID=29695 RepID=UPI002D797297|nr:uncharacterized protein LOC133909203 [Phragmites australis]
MADSTAMTIDFLRARLLSERSVSRAAKERADELAKRVAELEEHVRAVTGQRRQAERAAAEVLAILESQGFGGHLSDATDDSGSNQDGEEEEDAKSRGESARALGEEEPSAAQGEVEDALSGTAQLGGLSWKGRSVSPRKVRQLKQKHRRSYFYLLSPDSSPNYRMGQSCRKNKRRMELRLASPEEDGGNVMAAESLKGRQDGSDCTDDGQADMDGEAGGDEWSSGDGGGGQYVIRYEKDGDMERVLERQAELIGQYEEEEKSQREWEMQYNENRNANKGDVEVEHKPFREVHCYGEVKSSDKKLPNTSNPSAECLPYGSLSESPQNASQENGSQRTNEPDHGRAQTASISAQGSFNNSTITRQDEVRGDENSDGDSGFNANARSLQHYDAIKAPSEGSPSSDTLNSKVSEWSSSHFHDHTDNLTDAQPSRPSSSNADLESVLQALQRARISLRTKLSRPVPPSQVTLALPAPGDEHKEHDDLLANDDKNSYGEELISSTPARQEILALPAPDDYHEREDLPVNDTDISLAGKQINSSPPREEILALPTPGDDYRGEIEDYVKIPVSTPGLFRLPTDSFPADQTMFSSNAYGPGLSLGAAASRHAGFTSNPAAHGTAAPEVPSVSGDGSGFSAKQRYDLHSSALLSVPTSARCSDIPRPDFTVGSTSFPFGIPGLKEDLRRGMPLGDADLFMQRGIDYTISNKWML